ncbi:glutaminase kidney isoform, mitochondrial [Caerostris extrusa]|uniref:glutaminase n=1 Tax=Caerostris extrusa TaxID=172846 RepID=A0AAV4N8E1_CAEEX|nr:glutaminase kidney isoform, mitochondrial [Caerostris extrusa]
MITKLRTIHKEMRDMGSPDSITLDREGFKRVIKENIVLISRAFRSHFVIQDFPDFVKCIEDFYWKCKVNTGGKVASYIPQLAKYNPDYWGVSICTVDGQRCSIGDTDPLHYPILWEANELCNCTIRTWIRHSPPVCGSGAQWTHV